MVFFTCLKCGDAVQKPRVEKHYNTVCRKPVSVSCMDCFKDFHGDAFAEHTKCITEDERYAAKGYQAKPNANKGLQKQEKWIETIQTILKENPELSLEQKHILNILVKHENVPRKKPKFLNFLKNVNPRSHIKAAEAVFNLLENEHKKNNPPTENTNGSPQKVVKNSNPNTNGNDSLNSSTISNGKSKKTKSQEESVNETTNSSNKDKSKKSNGERFKWKPTILHFVSKKQSMKNGKLMKKVLQAYKLYHPELSDIPETVVQKYHIKLSKMKKVIVDDGLVKLK